MSNTQNTILEDGVSGTTTAAVPGVTHPEVSVDDQKKHIAEIQNMVMEHMFRDLKNKVYRQGDYTPVNK